jgi:nucleoside-diphosphate-sugar epimerase
VKLLVTGGTGLLSGALAELAVEQNMEVYMINRGNRRIPQGVRLLQSDINDRETVLSLTKNLTFDTVIDFISYNEEQLKNALSLLGDKTKQFIFVSSYAVYNTLVQNLCDENSPTWLETGGDRYWYYGLNKCKCEALLKRYIGQKGIVYTIVRPAVTYGNTRIPYGIAPRLGYHGTLIERALRGKPIITWNNGENRINITHVDDFSVGLASLIGNDAAYNETFNIAGEETPSWKEVLDALSEALDTPQLKTIDIPVEYLAEETSQRDDLLGGRSISAVCANMKIKTLASAFKQTIPLKEGVKRAVDYYFKHRDTLGIDYAFDGESDRIIAKYIKEFNLHCIKYNKLNLGDKIRYTYFRNKDCAGIRLLNTIRKYASSVFT